MKPSGNNGGVVVAITEEGRSSDETIEEVPEPTTPTDNETLVSRPRTLPPALTIPAKAHVRHEPKVESAGPSPVSPSPPASRAPSAADVPLPRSSTNTPGLDQKSSAMENEETPVMRSMFPSYNPNLSLARQDYAPNMAVVPPSNSTRQFSSNNPYVQQTNKSQTSLTRPSTATKEPKESPLRRSDSLKRASALSSPDELLDLWNIANGQGFEQAAESYVLELSW